MTLLLGDKLQLIFQIMPLTDRRVGYALLLLYWRIGRAASRFHVPNRVFIVDSHVLRGFVSECTPLLLFEEFIPIILEGGPP